MKIIKQVKRDNKWKITFDDGETLTLSENTVVKFRLFKDKEIEEKDLSHILADNENEVLFAKALRQLKYVRTTYQMKLYLRKQAARHEQINLIIDRLVKSRLLDDERNLATMTQKNTSKRALSFNLKRVGYDDASINEALTDFDETESLETLAQKVSSRYITKDKGKEKMYRYLISKGYESRAVMNVIRQYFK